MILEYWQKSIVEGPPSNYCPQCCKGFAAKSSIPSYVGNLQLTKTRVLEEELTKMK